MNKLRLLSASLIVIAAAVYWFVLFSPDDSSQSGSESADEIDFFMTYATIDHFDETGRLAYVIESPLVQHYRIALKSTMQYPLIFTHQNDNQTAQLSALHGEMPDNQSHIVFTGDVEIIDNILIETPTIMATSELTFIPAENFAETTQFIEIVKGNNVTTAVGMKTWLDKQVADLLNNVRGHYVTE